MAMVLPVCKQGKVIFVDKVRMVDAREMFKNTLLAIVHIQLI